METLSKRGRFCGASAINPRHTRECSQHAEAAADERKQERFSKKLANQTSARRTQRAANGELTLSRRGLREQQVGDIGAGNQEKKSHRSEQNEQRRASFAGDRVLQRDDHPIFEEIVVLLARGIVNAARNRADVRVRLLDRHAVAEAPDCNVVVRSPAGIFAVEIGRQPQAPRPAGTETPPGARR